MHTLEEFLEKKKNELNRSAHFATDDDIERTARDLEKINFEPPVFIPSRGFLRYRVRDIHREIDRIAGLKEEDLKDIRVAKEMSPEELKEKNINILVGQYLLLERLRAGEPEAWDEIRELYEDD